MALVKDIMNRNVVSVDGKDTVLKAAALMRDRNIGSVVVTRSKRPLGILTEKDFVRRVICEGLDPDSTSVEDVMSTPLIAVSPLIDVEEAADILEKNRVKKLGVVSADKLEGIITSTDILAAEARRMKLLERYVSLLSETGRRL
ncbi:MAG: CBS domain-containing protein [Candidatus Altiarchaeota archaeon]|nr:CBS domain-containing protein [Candidatus Altiarchaeota archaeon]